MNTKSLRLVVAMLAVVLVSACKHEVSKETLDKLSAENQEFQTQFDTKKTAQDQFVADQEKAVAEWTISVDSAVMAAIQVDSAYNVKKDSFDAEIKKFETEAFAVLDSAKQLIDGNTVYIDSLKVNYKAEEEITKFMTTSKEKIGVFMSAVDGKNEQVKAIVAQKLEYAKQVQAKKAEEIAAAAAAKPVKGAKKAKK